MGLKNAIASAFIKATGWKLDIEELPEKVLVVGAPHTSNWDALYMLTAFWKLGRKPHFLVKDSVVKIPVFGALVRGLGGIAVDRSGGNGLVGSLVERLEGDGDFILAVTPKGTRGKREFWKSGFYRIALEADIPLELGFVDSTTKSFGWSASLRLTGDVKADMEKIREFYADKTGIKPELTCTPRLRAEDDDEARDYLLSGL